MFIGHLLHLWHHAKLLTFTISFNPQKLRINYYHLRVKTKKSQHRKPRKPIQCQSIKIMKLGIQSQEGWGKIELQSSSFPLVRVLLGVGRKQPSLFVPCQCHNERPRPPLQGKDRPKFYRWWGYSQDSLPIPFLWWLEAPHMQWTLRAPSEHTQNLVDSQNPQPLKYLALILVGLYWVI